MTAKYHYIVCIQAERVLHVFFTPSWKKNNMKPLIVFFLCNHFIYWHFVNPFHFLWIHSKLKKTKQRNPTNRVYLSNSQFLKLRSSVSIFVLLNKEIFENKHRIVTTLKWWLQLCCILRYKTTVSILNYRACIRLK